MEATKIKDIMKTWVDVDTWHTGHPNDDKRFHLALSRVFDECGFGISFNDFEEALTELVDELHPNWDEEHKKIKIHKYALLAESIDSYLFDTE